MAWKQPGSSRGVLLGPSTSQTFLLESSPSQHVLLEPSSSQECLSEPSPGQHSLLEPSSSHEYLLEPGHTQEISCVHTGNVLCAHKRMPVCTRELARANTQEIDCGHTRHLSCVHTGYLLCAHKGLRVCTEEVSCVHAANVLTQATSCAHTHESSCGHPKRKHQVLKIGWQHLRLKEAVEQYLPGRYCPNPTDQRQYWTSLKHHNRKEMAEALLRLDNLSATSMDHTLQCERDCYTRGTAVAIALASLVISARAKLGSFFSLAQARAQNIGSSPES